MKLTVESLTIPRDGETENGDAVFVRSDEDAATLAVIDALGHGAHAAVAAAVALSFLGGADLGRGVSGIIGGLHERLRGTRGAAAMIVHLERGSLEGCGVGNVELRAHGTHVPVVLTPGVLGAQLSRPRIFRAPLRPRGRLVFFSDGISGRLSLESIAELRADKACRVLMERFRRPGDDATVLIADFEA